MKYKLPLNIVSVANLREHWAAKSKRTKDHRQTAKVLTPTNVALPCEITLTRIAPRELDTDNLASAFKAARDGIADRLGVNDKDPRITWLYAQRRGAPKEYTSEVEIISKKSESA